VESRNPIIVIAGPTASGKSDIAISLAKKINGYIINADSRQIYKELKIGTAQPVSDYVEDGIWYIDGVRHFLYGYKSIKDTFNISIYQENVQNILNSHNGIPILVGGTGLYMDCIVYNYDLKNEDINSTLRGYLSSLSVNELKSLVPKDTLNILNNSDRNNPRRLIRVIERKGKKNGKRIPLRNISFVIDVPREELTERIRRRTDLMFENGLEKEVENLFETYDPQLPAFNTIGYQEFREYFNGRKSLSEVESEIVTHTIQYAKRQRTWFKKNKNNIWTRDVNKIFQDAEQFITMS